MRTVIRILFLLPALFAAAPVAAVSVVAKEEAPYVSSKLPGQGLSMQIVRTALEKAGFKVKMTFENWPRAYEGAQIGVFDIIGSIWYTDRRAREFAFSEPYIQHNVKFVKRRKDDYVKYGSMDDLDGLIVGTLKDYAYGDEFLASRKFIRLPQNYLLQNLLKLSLGEIDMTLGEERKIRYELNEFMKGSVQDLEILPVPLVVRGAHIAVSRTNPRHKEIIDGFNKAIREMKADGSYGRIIAGFDTVPEK